ncbi:hypothetical protein TRFO_34922 [Tritrichomonas foetus]|uniref:Pre-rRNA-processing protein RIX1 n=1 Tax=Tritrichomonas foetus TaxID=1144522 RepID=A0A1J4JHL4_9EUKA|nr:hypothetical protein TRFO_34922 [Tritrichomonas foetus]|eukprot:OHS98642.1 hypothetical protein TRFO_34922 [Tritrichomonas foetus]
MACEALTALGAILTDPNCSLADILTCEETVSLLKKGNQSVLSYFSDERNAVLLAAACLTSSKTKSIISWLQYRIGDEGFEKILNFDKINNSAIYIYMNCLPPSFYNVLSRSQLFLELCLFFMSSEECGDSRTFGIFSRMILKIMKWDVPLLFSPIHNDASSMMVSKAPIHNAAQSFFVELLKNYPETLPHSTIMVKLSTLTVEDELKKIFFCQFNTNPEHTNILPQANILNAIKQMKVLNDPSSNLYSLSSDDSLDSLSLIKQNQYNEIQPSSDDRSIRDEILEENFISKLKSYSLNAAFTIVDVYKNLQKDSPITCQFENPTVLNNILKAAVNVNSNALAADLINIVVSVTKNNRKLMESLDIPLSLKMISGNTNNINDKTIASIELFSYHISELFTLFFESQKLQNKLINIYIRSPIISSTKKKENLQDIAKVDGFLDNLIDHFYTQKKWTSQCLILSSELLSTPLNLPSKFASFLKEELKDKIDIMNKSFGGNLPQSSSDDDTPFSSSSFFDSRKSYNRMVKVMPKSFMFDENDDDEIIEIVPSFNLKGASTVSNKSHGVIELIDDSCEYVSGDEFEIDI